MQTEHAKGVMQGRRSGDSSVTYRQCHESDDYEVAEKDASDLVQEAHVSSSGKMGNGEDIQGAVAWGGVSVAGVPGERGLP